ncbi:MAG: hypothetical protein NZ929_03685 [Aigarchaeota archaeon]|nr:hypothetical protein [Aigarchaeota archaeon]MCX8192817.1 hypothetical protein [Nitrososphaeria archaeon]MDW7986061.1 hypothetical protein [Nitrososphaerota archaeon]
MKLKVEAGSRIHLGFIDPIGVLGRRWGSVGLYLNEPKLSLTISKCNDIIVDGPRWLKDLAENIVKRLGIDGLMIECSNHIPRHVGLGSGTQTILSIGLAVSKIYKLDLTLRDIALMFNRCRKSGAGFWLFQVGGIVIDGGNTSEEEIPPLLARFDLPEEWMILLAIPLNEGLGLHGRIEEEKFKMLNAADPKEASLIILMKLLPSIVQRNFERFSEAVEELDLVTSRFFETAQSGRYFKSSSKVVEFLKNIGVRGVGQSSWGPTIYGFLESSEVEEVGKKLKNIEGFRFIFTTPRNKGAEISQLQSSF